MSNYQVMPDLDPEEFNALKTDIAERGVMVPVEYDEDGNVLDGHHRLRACEELGINDWPRIVRSGLDETGKRIHARQLNLSRRHLNREQRRSLIQEQLKETPELSDNQIAKSLGVSDKTVTRQREDLVQRSEIPNVTERTDSLGRQQPATKPKTASIHLPGDDGAKAVVSESKSIRQEKADQRRKARLEELGRIVDRSPTLSATKKYPLIYADPPWRYEHSQTVSRDIENQYPTMSLIEICHLPVADLALDDCVLLMWTTSPKLRESMDVLDAWGFEYRTCAVWDKEVIGMGYYFRQQHELLLVATKGSVPVPEPSARPSSIFKERRGKHSRKPEAAYQMIEAMYPELPKIELFARSSRPGWDSWGNQA